MGERQAKKPAEQADPIKEQIFKKPCSVGIITQLQVGLENLQQLSPLTPRVLLSQEGLQTGFEKITRSKLEVSSLPAV